MLASNDTIVTSRYRRHSSQPTSLEDERVWNEVGYMRFPLAALTESDAVDSVQRAPTAPNPTSRTSFITLLEKLGPPCWNRPIYGSNGRLLASVCLCTCFLAVLSYMCVYNGPPQPATDARLRPLLSQARYFLGASGASLVSTD